MRYFTNFFSLYPNFFSTNIFGKYFANIFSNYPGTLLRQPLTYISLPHYLICLFNTPIFIPPISQFFLYLIRFIYSLYIIPLCYAYISFIHSLYFTYYILFALFIVCYFYILFALYLYHFTAHQIILPLVTLYFVLHTLPPLTSCFINTGKNLTAHKILCYEQHKSKFHN